MGKRTKRPKGVRLTASELMTAEERTDMGRYLLKLSPEEERARWDEWKARWGDGSMAYSRYKSPETEKWARVFETEEEERTKRRKASIITDPANVNVVTSKKGSKINFGEGLVITDLKNTRKEGTGAHSRVMALAAYLKVKGDGVTVADALRDTPYRKDDYQWDFQRGAIKVVEKGKKNDDQVSGRKGPVNRRKR